jgi:hypothetical protein
MDVDIGHLGLFEWETRFRRIRIRIAKITGLMVCKNISSYKEQVVQSTYRNNKRNNQVGTLRKSSYRGTRCFKTVGDIRVNCSSTFSRHLQLSQTESVPG